MKCKRYTLREAKALMRQMGYEDFDLREFAMGLNVENEHSDITFCDPEMTARIAAAHLRELPDYYTRLRKMERGR